MGLTEANRRAGRSDVCATQEDEGRTFKEVDE